MTRYAEASITITPKAVTITVDNASKTVGTEDPAFIGTVEGLVNSSDLGEITYNRTNDDEVVGTYEGVLTANYTPNSNYDVTVIPGNFTITQNEGTKYTVQYWYQDPTTGEHISAQYYNARF